VAPDATQRDRREIANGVVRKLWLQAWIDRVRHGRQQDRVAVRRCFRDEIGPDDLSAAATIIDDDRLPDRLADFVCDTTGDDVGRSAGRVGNDQPDRTRGIRLRQSASTQRQTDASHHDLPHLQFTPPRLSLPLERSR